MSENERESTDREKSNGLRLSRFSSGSLQLLVHGFCILLYLIPILAPNPYSGPTLDELHIMSPDNKDISGDSPVENIFKNDYWGRPMQSESSHKSWRPLTVLSFRYLKGIYTGSQLTMHRTVNVITHAAAAEAVGVLANRLFTPFLSSPTDTLLLKLATKVAFALHPTHVEVTANAANRNHILAVLFSATISDPECPIWFFAMALVAGFLCSETFLFQVPAAIVTVIVIRYYADRRPNGKNDSTGLLSVLLDYIVTLIKILPRICLMILAVIVYLGGRAYFDTLDIPEGLIRPAENPFYDFEGDYRVRNYLYILTIHLAKSWGMDPIGFSHEYGFECIPALEDWNDHRLKLTYGVGAILAFSLILAFSFPRALLGPVAIHWAWSLTLFPVSGLVKVGTFVSDRIVVASTVSVSLWFGGALWFWLTRGMRMLPAAPLQAILVGWIFTNAYLKVQTRSSQWMDSISLLESSLETCPRFAKVHMEMSKIYSGLYADKFNLMKARYHLDTAREIDPDMCDLHQQFAHVAIQEGNFLEYEEELTQAVLCKFTMGGAFPMWQRYWQAATSNAHTDSQKQELQRRQAKHTQTIQDAVAKAQQEEAEAARQAGSQPQKPFFSRWWK